MPYRVLSVHAHPDDESSKGAALLAKLVDDGHEVMVVSCTGGERGDILNQEVADTPLAHRDLPGLRRIEMARAREVLGIQHRWLGYQDSGFNPGEPAPADSFADISLDLSSRPLVRLIRQYRPHVMLTYDERGGYPHPDHIRTHEVSMRALADAASAEVAPELGEAWQISKVYFDQSFNYKRYQAIVDEMVARDPSFDASRFTDWLGRMRERPARTSTHIDVGAYLEQGRDALRAHASQVPPDSTFFAFPIEAVRAAWPWEDLELALTTVPVAVPEHDLFAGLGPA